MTTQILLPTHLSISSVSYQYLVHVESGDSFYLRAITGMPLVLDGVMLRLVVWIFVWLLIFYLQPIFDTDAVVPDVRFDSIDIVMSKLQI